MIEGNDKLYGVVDNTLVSISSINEFDGNKDWLAQQIACDDDDEEEESPEHSNKNLKNDD